MKNLQLNNISYNNLPIRDIQCTYNYDNELFIANEAYVYKLNDGTLQEVLDFTLCLEANDREISQLIDLFISTINETLYIIFEAGDVISLNFQTMTPEYMGCFDAGILSVGWSPSEEFLVLVSGSLTMNLMQLDLEMVSEVGLLDNGEVQFVNVGWGKKETQFRGKEGKLTNVQPSEMQVSSWDDGKVRISWRGDGEFYAISFLFENKRRLKMFSKEGVLQYTSEDTPGLESALAWKPSGTVIACTRRLPNKYVVCFFEKNGLLHGEFAISSEEPVIELLWNSDSSLLCVFTKSYIMLYSTQNYHWYLKYTIEHQGKFIFWDKKYQHMLHVLMNNQWVQYEWSWIVNKSQGTSENDGAWVGVIDGYNLLLTSFKAGIIPPPMCSRTIICPNRVNSVIFLQFSSDDNVHCNDFFIQLSNGLILFYQYNYEINTHELTRTFELYAHAFNFCWVEPSLVIFCVKEEMTTMLKKIKLFDKEMSEELILKQPGNISTIKKHPKSSQILFFNDRKQCQVFDYINNVLKPYEIGQTQSKVIQFEIQDIQNSCKLFRLDVSNKFYIDSEIIASNVTSFVLHDQFVLLTTLQHKLICWNLTSNVKSDSRSVEIGARLIISIPGTTKVVMQMPRGNLECIQPRSLSINLIQNYLNNALYHKTYIIMRKERINLNLIYDHDPEKFLANVHVFLNEITDSSWLCTFVTDLLDEDMTQTMYKEFYPESKRNNAGNKVERVCRALETTINKLNKDDFLLPLLSAQVKRKATDVALLEIKSLKERENNGEKLKTSSSYALKHILYLVDVDQLYRHALGTYDLNLVHFIASKSQKDPKEYIPFLNDLQQLETHYQKFTIEKFLKHYEKALEHLSHCEEHRDECLNFIETHKLYKTGLRLFQKDTDRYKEVCALYANHLAQLKEFEGAGVYYRKANLLEKALQAFKNCNSWQDVINCAEALNVDNKENLYIQLARALINDKRYLEAATIFLDYLKNVSESVAALCNGCYFEEAFRIVDLYESKELIEGLIRPAIIEQLQRSTEEIINFQKVFNEQTSRLAVVRETKKHLTDQESGFMENDDDASICASSAASRSTNRTRSSKNSRKLERKMLSLKEGSPYEDIALIISLFDILSNTVKLKVIVRTLNLALVRIDEISEAAHLQQLLDSTLTNMEDASLTIWNENYAPKSILGPQTTSNSIASDFTSQNEVNLIFKNPKILFPPDFQKNLKWKMEFLY